MTASEPKQPVAVVAESLMRTCYDEANRIANHCSDGAARMAMRNLYDAANEAKARLAAAADDSRKSPPAEREAFAAATGYAAWHERPSCGGWWWNHEKQTWREAYEDGIGTLIVAAPENVKGWHYASEESGGWWGPWTPPAMPHTKKLCNDDEQPAPPKQTEKL